MWRVGSNRNGRTLRLKMGWHRVVVHGAINCKGTCLPPATGLYRGHVGVYTQGCPDQECSFAQGPSLG
jgi:hypothetical protein